MELNEYHEIMDAWAEEVKPLMEGFKSLFPDTTEGTIKYLFALHFMLIFECAIRGIPREATLEAVPAMVASWHVAGKPEGVEILCINGMPLCEMAKHIQEIREQMGKKPSSDA